MDVITRFLQVVNPKAAATRAFWQAQTVRLYEAAQKNPYHRKPGQQGSADKSMDHARGNIRDWARWLDENHDLAIGILDNLVNKTVGAGIQVMPMVLDRKSNRALRELNREINFLWRDWIRNPEVTHELNFAAVQRLSARTLYRDGEILAQHVLGNTGRVVHAGKIPYSVELIEGDFLPFDFNDSKRNITHGVEKTAWNRPRAYHLFKTVPDNRLSAILRPDSTDLKRVPAERMIHAKFTRRINQTRGVSVFHGVAHRLDDIKDYEESERIAARIGASFAAYIQKGTDFDPQSAYAADGVTMRANRTMEMKGGMIFDDLLPGESVGTIDTNRPNTSLMDYRNSQMKAIAAGTGTQYSSISRNYDGTYSAQRQELVESMASYAAMREYLVYAIFQPIYEQFIVASVLSNNLQIPGGLELSDLFSAGWIAPPQPWIDPAKEAAADEKAVQNHFIPWSQVVLQRTGRDPMIVLEQIREEQELLKDLMPAPVAAEPAPAPAADAPAPDAPATDETDNADNEAA